MNKINSNINNKISIQVTRLLLMVMGMGISSFVDLSAAALRPRPGSSVQNPSRSVPSKETEEERNNRLEIDRLGKEALTGNWEIYGRYLTTVEKKLKMDFQKWARARAGKVTVLQEQAEKMKMVNKWVGPENSMEPAGDVAKMIGTNDRDNKRKIYLTFKQWAYKWAKGEDVTTQLGS